MNKVSLLLGILLVIAVAVAGYFYLQTQKDPGQALGPYTPSVSENPTPSPAEDETNNWETFTFEENQVSFKYPADLTVSYFPTDNTGKFEADRMASGENAILKRGNIKIMGINPNQAGIGGIPGPEYKQEKLMVDGYEMTKHINTTGTYFATTLYDDKTLMATCFSEVEVCNKILPTFEFTN